MTILVISIWSCAYASGARGGLELLTLASGADSLLPVRIDYDRQEEIAGDLLAAEDDYSKTGDGRKAIRHLARVLKLRRPVWEGQAGYRLFNNLAVFSARLKLYPLAMKCYYRALELKGRGRMPVYEAPESEDSISYEYLLDIDSCCQPVESAGGGMRSTAVAVREILASFDDGKDARSYAIMVHVKQPITGRRKAFTHINNVGHMFITLIKYNCDNSSVSRSFGFYPHKKNIFSATPFHVRAPSVIKDDAGHDWDEVVGKYISARRFSKILQVLQRYDGMVYDLNRNNCTDFGLNVAGIAGIDIMDTRGRWPLGKGNNPANAGQSMLERKIRNTDDEQIGELFRYAPEK